MNSLSAVPNSSSLLQAHFDIWQEHLLLYFEMLTLGDHSHWIDGYLMEKSEGSEGWAVRIWQVAVSLRRLIQMKEVTRKGT